MQIFVPLLTFKFFCLLELSKEKYHLEYEKFPFSVLFFDVSAVFYLGCLVCHAGIMPRK